MLWYYADFASGSGPKTLWLGSKGGCYRVAALDDAGKESPAPGAVLHVDGRAVKGSYTGSCIGPHRGLGPRDGSRDDPLEHAAVRYAAAMLVLLAAALAGCGGQATHGTATLWVTRDRGAHVLLVRSVPAGETAMQALTRAVEVEDALRRPLRPGDQRGRGIAVDPPRLVLLRERGRGRSGAPPR